MAPQDSASDLDQLELSGAKATTSFSQYPEYKDSGLEWLGPVPKHWVYGRTDRYLAYRKEQVSPDDLREEVVAYYSIPNFQAYGTYALEEPRNINSDKLRINGGELLVSKLNPRKNSVILTEKCEYTSICSTEFVPMLPERVDPRYALYFYKSEYVRQTLDARVESVTRSHQRADPDQILKIWTCFPPLDEQRAIAAFLDRETAKIDALIEKKQRLLDRIKERLESEVYHLTLGKGVDSEKGDSSYVWEKCPRLKYACPYISVGVVVQPSNYYSREGVPFLRALNVRPFAVDNSELEYLSEDDNEALASSKLRAGDIICVRSGRPGTTAVVPKEYDGANCVDMIIVRRDGQHDPEYLCHLMNSAVAFGQYELMSAGAIQKHFNVEMAKNLRVPMPGIDRQRALKREMDQVRENHSDLTKKLGQQISHLREYRTALISAAVTGQIDVRGRV
jgi:type I restriction enzyme S subunit